MFHLFRNRDKGIHPKTVRASEAFDRKVTELKTRLARGFAEKTQNWSMMRWKLFLILFCIVSAGISSYVIVDALNGSKSGYNYTILPFVVPKYSAKPEGLKKIPGFLITEQEYNKLIQFDRYVDSLGKTESGKLRYDSIMKYRYGLLDTIHRIEQLYILQRNKTFSTPKP